MGIDTALLGSTDDTDAIRCDVSDEPTGARRYVLQVPARAVPRTQALIDDLLSGRYHAAAPTSSDDIGATLAAFRRLLEQMS